MASFELRQLEYYIQAVDDKNLSTAAKNLFVSHQALSKSIKNLEAQLGIELLQRGSSGVVPTEFGLQFYEKAREIIDQSEALDSFCSHYKAGTTDNVNMGFVPGCLSSNGGTVHTEDLMRFQNEHPDAACTFRDVTSDAIARDFEMGRINLATSMTGFDEAKFSSIMLWDFPVAAVISSDNPLASREAVSFSDLAGESFVISSEYFAEFGRVCKIYDFHPTFSPLQTSLGWDEKTIHDNDVVVIYPLQHSCRIFEPGLVSIIPLMQDGKPVTYPLYIIWKKNDHLTQMQAMLRDFIVDLYKKTHPAPEEMPVLEFARKLAAK